MKALLTSLVALLTIAGAIALKPQPKVGGGVQLSQMQINAQLATEESTYAEIDPKTGEVLRTIVIDQANLDTGKWGDPKNWVRTSKEKTIRGNYAGKGYTYDKVDDMFIPPQPTDAIGFSTDTAEWIIPIDNTPVSPEILQMMKANSVPSI